MIISWRNVPRRSYQYSMFLKIKRTTGVALVGLAAAALLLSACNQLSRTAVNAANQNGQSTAAGAPLTVTKSVVETTIVATGKVVARDVADIGFQRAGQVISLTVEEGSSVKKGQLIAMLDTTSLYLTLQQQYLNYISAQASYSQTIKGPSEIELASAMAALASAQATYYDLFKAPSDNEVANLKATLDNAKASLDVAQANYDRAFQRNPAGIGGSGEGLSLQTATNNYLAAKANYDKAFEKSTNASLSSAAAQIASAKVKLESLSPVTETIIQAKAKMDQAYITWQQAQTDIANTVLYAPYDGLVIAVAYHNGDWVGSGQTVVSIANVTNPWFEIDIDEADLGSIVVGQSARVQLQAYPNQPISATVESIAPAGTTSSSSVTFKVKMVLGGPTFRFNQGQGGTGFTRPAVGRQVGRGGSPTDTQAISGTLPAGGRAFTETQGLRARPIIRMGMSGTAEVITAQRQNVVAVPNGALSADRVTRNYTVVKVTGETAQTVPVTIGLRGSTMTEITEGLSEGDTISVPRSATSTSSTFAGPGGGNPAFGPGGR